MRQLALLATCLMLASGPAATLGQDLQVGDDPSPFSEAALLSEKMWIEPGVPLTLGVRLIMDDGWHSYWQNPGDSGEPTEITWSLPPGFEAGPTQWPFPEKIDAGPLRSYGYANEVVFLSDIVPPKDLQAGTAVTISATAEWLICAEVCLFAEETVVLSLPVRPGTAPPGPFAETLARARTRLPVTLPGLEVQAEGYAQSIALQVTLPEPMEADLNGAYFFPADLLVLEHAANQPMSRDGASFVFALQQSDYGSGTPVRLRGVLMAPEGRYWDAERTLRALAIDVPVQLPPADATSAIPLPLLLVFAFTGGLLLNLMPCVLPIVSVKVLGFAHQGRLTAGTARRHGLVFAGAVIASFWVLAGMLLAVRAGGTQIGWGFQLQSPHFVAGMALLFFVIGLSLLGVFEVRTLSLRWADSTRARGAYQRSFWDGALATLVATPCSAPFMGAALGAAVVLPALEALLIFTCLGAGMATPYVVMSLIPQLVSRLPKPGAWTETLKHILAFPMIATTIWLVWVFGNQAGVDGVAFLLAALLLLGIALWLLGRWPAVHATLRVRLATRSVAALAALLSFLAVYQGAQSTASPTPDSAWQSFSVDRIDALHAEGRAAFVDFTAAWCLTCQVNKRTTLNSETVRNAFARKDVSLFRADWTSRDEEITRALASHGRNGVPLYVLYPGNDRPPVLLPEVLTEAIVLDALESLPNRDDQTDHSPTTADPI